MADNKDGIDKIFNQFKNQFDIREPNKGHQQRFLDKLNDAHKSTKKKHAGIFVKWWKPLSIAASIVLMIGLGLGITSKTNPNNVVKVSEDMQKAQFYFAKLVNTEIEKVNALVTPDTKRLVNDAMAQIKKLEEDYKKLEKQLSKNGDTEQLLHAMVKNFQTRINLLQEVLNQIENVKKIKHEITSI